MLVNVCSHKGGVSKTTTAIHLACYFSQFAKTLLIDGDPNRSASVWARAGKLPFQVADERVAARYAQGVEHFIVDTQARLEEDDLKVLADGSDLLVLPTTPDGLSLDALMLTISALRNIGATNYVVLVAIVPPRPVKDGDEAMRALTEAELPVFPTMIRRFIAYQRAAVLGVPVYEVDDRNAQEAWQDYLAIGKEILG